MWIGVDLKTYIKTSTSLKEIELRAPNMLTILGSLANVVGGGDTYMTN